MRRLVLSRVVGSAKGCRSEGSSAPPQGATASASPTPGPSAPSKPAATLTAFLGSRLRGVSLAGDHVAVYRDSDTFAWVVMNRANSSANALGEDFMASLEEALTIVDGWVEAGKARVAIIASAKDTFCVGADLTKLYPCLDASVAKAASAAGQAAFARIEQRRYPIVAAINGAALGGGTELALACHYRVIADEKGTMGLPETMLGLLPGAGGCVRLPRLIGVSNALQWILQGAPKRASACKSQGAVDAVLPATPRFGGEERFLEGVRQFAGKLVDRPRRQRLPSTAERLMSLPPTLWAIKQYTHRQLVAKTHNRYPAVFAALDTVVRGVRMSPSAALEVESGAFGRLLLTPEAKNLISLYFLDDGMKKLEAKTGVTKDQLMPVEQVGVIGAGVMGLGIVNFFAKKDYRVSVVDLAEENIARCLKTVASEFDGEVKRKRMSRAEATKKTRRVRAASSNDVLRGTQMIVEAAVEVMAVKKKIVQELESTGILNGSVIFATNTSSLSLTELQQSAKFPEMIVGMHFFNPVAKMPLVEVIKGAQSSPVALATVYNAALKAGKKPIVVGDAPGFLVNRILGVYMAEAGRLVSAGFHPSVIDKAILGFGMPMGPFRLLDEVGLDVACHVGPVLQNGLRSDRFAVMPAVEKMAQAGYLGKKNGKGFYSYASKKPTLDAATVAAFLGPLSTTPPSGGARAVVERCVSLMVNEAAMILSEGVAQSPEDVDIGMIFGTGFPPFRGGLLQHADHVGIGEVVKCLEKYAAASKSDVFAPCPLLRDMAGQSKRFFPNRVFVPLKDKGGA